MTSCVSKKKFLALERKNGEIQNELTKTKVEKEDLESKFDIIQARVDKYNNKINSLTQEIGTLSSENDVKFDAVGNTAVISNAAKRSIRATLAHVDPYKLRQAKTLKDSMNLAVSHQLKRAIDTHSISDNDQDIAVNIEETVVMISISDKMLFNSGSYKISSKANNILQKLADIINSEPSIEVMVEGHTDARSIHTELVSDNWDLSVLRATSVVRKLQMQYHVDPAKLIASGRSSYHPLTDNDSRESRSKNRRTRIVILPNINKFFALMSNQG